MNTPKIVLLSLSIAIVSACSSIKVEQDYNENTDFSALKSYAWQTDKQPGTGDVRVDNSLLNNRIREAIDNELANKGQRKVARNKANYLLAYHYVIREKDEYDGSSVRTGIGVGVGHHGGYGGLSFGFGDRKREYDEGELTIDMLNPANKQIIWRGVASRKIINQSDPAERTKRVRETVQAILRKFPPRK